MLSTIKQERHEEDLIEDEESYQSPRKFPNTEFTATERYIFNEFSRPFLDPEDYSDLSSRILLLKEVDDGSFKNALIEQMAPWIKKLTVIKEGRGIVMSVGNEFMKVAGQAISILRYWDPSISIHVTYSGLFDLDTANIELLLATNVTVSNLCDSFNCTELDLDKWDAKPFTLLSSPFEETILIDADTVFLQSPWNLFDDIGYRETGALFFKDRTLFPGNDGLARWIKKVLPKPFSDHLLDLRILNAKTQYEQESGVIAVNNKLHYSALLAVCMLNTPFFREPIRMMTHGEKETFWMGFEVAKSSVSFMPSLPGSIGRLERSTTGEEKICGHLAHFDRDGGLLWFNDGLVQGKHDSDYGIDEPAVFTHFGQEGEWTDDLCIISYLSPLNEDITNVLDSYKNL